MQFSKYHHFQFHSVTIAVEMFLTQKNLIILMQFTIRKKRILQCEKDWNVWCDKKNWFFFSRLFFAFLRCLLDRALGMTFLNTWNILQPLAMTLKIFILICKRILWNSQVFCYHSVREVIFLDNTRTFIFAYSILLVNSWIGRNYQSIIMLWEFLLLHISMW